VFVRSAKGVRVFGVLCHVYANLFDGWVGASLSPHVQAGVAKGFPSQERRDEVRLSVNIMSGAVVTLPIILGVQPIIKLI
jgi:hypothetical protein